MPDAPSPQQLISVDRARLVRTTRDLISIPSVNPFGSGHGTERAAIEYVARRLEAAGFEVARSRVEGDRYNVIGRLSGAGRGPSVALAGHLDTVDVAGHQAPFDARIVDGRIYGRGAADMKGGVAAMLEVADLASAHRARLGGDLVVLGICDEEYLMIGSRALSHRDIDADFAIVMEPTDLAICPAHRGQVGLIVSTHGVAGHSSTGRLEDNAISHMGAVLVALEQHAAMLQQRTGHPLTGPGSLSVGVIRGGELMAIVPSGCEIEVDRRTQPGETASSVEAEIDAVLTKIAAEREGFSYSLHISEWDVPGLDTPLDHEVVTRIAAAHQAVTGIAPRITAFPAATDAPHLGLPCVVYGPGSLGQAHSHEEWVAIDDLVTAAEVVLGLLTMQA